MGKLKKGIAFFQRYDIIEEVDEQRGSAFFLLTSFFVQSNRIVISQLLLLL